MSDSEGYPTQEDLDFITNWKFTDGVPCLIDHLQGIWWYADWGFKLTGKRILKLELHTGGWSGNEDIIQALSTTMFWNLYWGKSVRGGHYYFVIKPIKK